MGGIGKKEYVLNAAMGGIGKKEERVCFECNNGRNG